MTLEELKAEFDEIKKRSEGERRAAMIKYAKANNAVEVGDVVKDHLGLVLVEKIKFWLDLRSPACTYIGTILRADGKPKKGRPLRTVHQHNVQAVRKLPK